MAPTTTARPRPRTLTQHLLGSRLLASMTAPHGVDRYLEIVNPMWAAREVRARVVDRVVETRAGAPVATLTLQPTDTWAGFRAGQHVQVGVELPGGRRTTRVFSISSAASGPGEPFTLTMRANPEGQVSRFLVEAEPGTLLHLSQAEGDFVLPGLGTARHPDRVLLLSGGSGITPVMSMLRTLRAASSRPHVTFVHHAQSAEHQIFAEELAGYAGEDWVDLHLVHGGQFTAEGLAELLPDHTAVPTWACGPAGMIDLVQQAYDGHDTLHVEFFKTPLAHAGTAEGDVTFTRSGATGANTGATLLEQAEALGLRPEFGCRMGICFSCTARKSEGTVRHVVSGAESSLPDEDIQLCVQAPVGDCTVDL